MKNYYIKIQLLLSAIFFIGCILAFWSVYKEVNKNNQKAEQSLIELNNNTNEREEMKTIDHLVEIVKDDQALLETHFAKSSDIVPFLDTLETSATTAGIVAKVDSVDVATNNTALSVRVNATGTFEGVYKFLKLLENFPYQLEITSINLQREVTPSVTPEGVPILDLKPKWQATFKIKLISFVP